MTVGDEETPVIRFLEYQSNDTWSKIRKLSDKEINLLAYKIVEQVKLRGPFLSYADFVNRRLQGNQFDLFAFEFEEWNDSEKKETRDSALGLRGAIQAGIAEAKLNQANFKDFYSDEFIPEIPPKRFDNAVVNYSSPWPLSSENNFVSSNFGIHAVHSQRNSHNINFNRGPYWSTPVLIDDKNIESIPLQQKWGGGIEQKPFRNVLKKPNGTLYTARWNHKHINKGDNLQIIEFYSEYEDLFSHGEAPENLLAVENVATGANTPGWVMQSDLLSPLAPVSSVRSDTFVIRVMGEALKNKNEQLQSKAWIELTVQRIPDYIKSDKDNPHHRPHEPFEDRNFNGYWDGVTSHPEHWIDLDQDLWDRDQFGNAVQKQILDRPGSYPDSPSNNDEYADGLRSDLPINFDEDEESSSRTKTSSHKGINQRFGRKFKIIKFRWLNAQDV